MYFVCLGDLFPLLSLSKLICGSKGTQEIKKVVSSGGLVSDDIVLKILEEKVN